VPCAARSVGILVAVSSDLGVASLHFRPSCEALT
jgi:hypothetical protein